MTQKFPKLFLFLLGILLLLNIVQSIFTELIYDEAYYWYYAQNLAWGYFDHPPMVAFMVTISGLIFTGELGVRFMSCVLGAGTYALIWLMVDHEKKNKYIPHFFLLLFSMALINAYGFLTLPDTPLLFFTALFLFIYKKLIEKPSLLLSVGLGIAMGALMYSKYHAVLVIIFVVISNWRLILNKYAWLALVVSLICYLPHFLWLYKNDFVTINYHLFERPNHAYSFSEFTLGYFLNLILIFGLLFPWMYLALFKSKNRNNKFVKSLKYLSYGFIFFFFISSFNRRVQTQWVVVICIPMAILAFQYLLYNASSRKWIFRLGVASAVILLYARIWLVADPLLPFKYETHGNREWVRNLENVVDDTPVIFKNSYRRASMYAYYSGNTSYSLNTLGKRHNQYSIDNSELKIQGKKVAFIAPSLEQVDFNYNDSEGQEFTGNYIESFESSRKLVCFTPNNSIEFSESDSTLLKVYNPYPTEIPISNVEMTIAYLNEFKQLMELAELPFYPVGMIETLKSNDTTYFRCIIEKPKENNIRYLQFGISENGLPAGINSKKIKILK